MNRIILALTQVMAFMPEVLLWPFAKRYVAGSTLSQALTVIRDLTDQNLLNTVDILGEAEHTLHRITEAKNSYIKLLQALHTLNPDEGNVSLKPSQFGLLTQTAACYTAIEAIVKVAADHNQFVRLDMEDSQSTDATLALYRHLRQHYPNLGIVLQARLHRTPQDIARLQADGLAHIRLCKGIYLEPPNIAHTQPQAITQAFIDCMLALLTGPTQKLAIASHDPFIVKTALQHLKTSPPNCPVEFQMLLGVAEPLRRQLQQNKQPVRVYVPYGQQWKAYCIRRFRENPQLLGHVIKSLFR